MENDKIILELQEKIKSKKEKLANIQKAEYITNATFKENINTNSININVANEEDIIYILSFLLNKENFYNKAAAILLSKMKFKHQGFSVSDWEHDLKIRMDRIYFSNKKKELEDLENRLAKLESPKLKEQKELDEIKKLLADD
jgi:hypothetical protein